MKKNVKFGLIALFICASTSAIADDSFSWHGYMRAGTGLTSDRSVEGFNENQIGRFGNEYNTWVTSTLNKKFTNENGSWAELTLSAYGWMEDSEVTGPWVGTESGWNAGTDKGAFYIGDNNVKFGGLDFLPKDSTLRVGKVGINKDIHVLDYKYQNLEGTGAVYNSKDLDIGFVTNETGYVNASTLDLTYRMGSIETKATLSKGINGNSEKSATSILVNYGHGKLLGVMPGYTSYIAQVGVGVTAGDLNKVSVNNKDGGAFRFIVDGHGSIGNFTVNPVALMESTNYDADTSKTYTSLTAGGRVSQKITNNLGMMYEGFVNNVENKNGTDANDGSQYKVAAGPVIQLEMGEWVRPVVRFSATLIGGEQKITGLTDKDGKGIDSEFRLGAQYEAWF